MTTPERLLLGYRLPYHTLYDPEAVWALVQRHNGYISIKAGGEYWFWVYREHEVFLNLAFPLLIRAEHLDYV
jgi:hypothetical protein